MDPKAVKTKTEDLLDCFWSAGFNSAYTVIEQISNLIFMRFLEEQHDRGIETIYQTDEDGFCRWSKFRDLEENELFSVVKNRIIPFIKNVQLNNSTLKLLQTGLELQLSDGYLLKRAINLIDELYESEIKNHVPSIADAFELLLSGINENLGRNGQYVTPRHIVEVIVRLIEPSKFETICDPVCGSGGFLVYAYRLFQCSNLKGYDLDPTMTRVAAINLLLHGVEEPIIHRLDTNEDFFDEKKSDIIFMNPPFGVRTQNQDKTNKNSENDTVSEKKYIRLALKLLKENGRGAAIVPDGILYGASHRDLRHELIDNDILEGIISLPSGVFRPFTGAKTSIIIFAKCNGDVKKTSNSKLWYYEVKSDGFSLDDRRSVLPSSNRNDLDDILNRWESREEDWNLLKTSEVISQPIELPNDSRVLFVPTDYIIENDYDLSLSRYRKFHHETLDLEEPSVILNKIFMIEEELKSSLVELNNALNYELDEKEVNEKIFEYNEHISLAEQEAIEQSKVQEIKLDFSHVSFFLKNLSKKQREYFDIFVNSKIPLASHEAAKRLNEAKGYEGSEKYDPQQAKQSVMLLESIGLLEKSEPEAIQYLNSKDSISIDEEEIFLDKWKITSIHMQ